MDNFNNFSTAYQGYGYQANSGMPNSMYYQPTATTPVGYRQYSPQYSPQYPPTAPYNNQGNNQMVGGIIWVQGESGAKSYIIPNGTTVPLWDSENQVIYIKTVDNEGRPSMTILDYTQRDAEKKQPEEKLPEYATVQQFDELKRHNAELINEITSQVIDIQQKLSEFKPFANSTTNNNRKGNNNGKSSV